MSLFAKFKQHRRLDIYFFVFSIGLLLLLVLFIWRLRKETNPVLAYDPADVVYGISLRANHSDDGIPITALPYKTALPGKPRPLVSIPMRAYDFGSIPADRLVSREFTIANQGDAPLLISEIHSSSHCLDAQISAMEIPPGKIALLTVWLDPGSLDEKNLTIRRSVFLVTNDPLSPLVEIWVQAEIR